MLSFIFLTLLTVRSNAQSAAYGGGIGFTGSTTCVSGFSCVYSNDWFSQCVPSTAIPPTLSTSRITTTTSSKTTLTTVKSTSTTSTSSSPTSTASGKTKFAGVNIAGFDFGCTTDGACDLAQTKDPTAVGGYLNGIEQMKHFATDDHLNMFRLPVGWQYLSSTPGGTLDSAHFARYDSLVQGCLATGAYCIIDIHNYARWNGAIIGQGGPTNAQFANTWSQIAKKYASQSRVGFGIMNEPHDVPDSTAWAATVQAAVTAIRSAGATTQLILLPGNNWTSAQTFISSGSAAALSTVKNLDGSTTNLIYDVHKYLDSDNSGTHSECVTNNIDSSFAPLATYLRANGRQAILSETGGGNVSSCQTYLCQQLAYLNANSDVYIGYTTWSAGEFDATWNYILTEVPTYNNGVWIDQPLVKSCVAR